MEATQMLNDSVLESDEEENDDNQTNKRSPVAKLHILKNQHMPETELPLFLGENVLGRDGSTCSVPLPSPSISKRHATISISLYRSRGEVGMEALVWDLGSMNGTRKGRLKLTPNVRYALGEHDSLVLADIPCQYVSCSADTVSSQHNFKTPVSVSPAVRARLTDDSNRKASGTDVGSENSDRAPEALEKVSSPALKDTHSTPLRNICLSFEQTPTQPQGTLVPESDLDSDEERQVRATRRQKTSDSDCDLNKSSPTCSTFLSPTNKVVPESEDESPITPPIPSKNRAHRHVSFNKEETNRNEGRQQLKEKAASEEEDGTLKGKISAGCGPREPGDQGSNDETVSTAAVGTDAFGVDSDTDLEGEEEGVAAAVPATLAPNRKADRTSDAAQFYMDSDTDVEEDEHHTTSAKPVPQPEGRPADGDADAEEEGAKPVSHLTHFHLDSDTEGEEEEEDTKLKRAQSNPPSDEASPASAGPVPAALPGPDSETDDEAPAPAPAPAPALGKSGVAETGPAAHPPADLDILSDSDTDVEGDSPPVKQAFVGTNLSVTRGGAAEAIPSGSDADTDVEEAGPALLSERAAAAGLHGEGEKEVEDEVNLVVPGEGRPVRENPAGLLNSSHQFCSTPVQLPEVEEDRVEHMDTQAFVSPTSGVRRAAARALRTEALAFDSDSQEDESIVVAETQSFVLRGGGSEGHVTEAARESDEGRRARGAESFQLGLSDSSLLLDPGRALAMESTQAFVSVEAAPLANQTPSTDDPQLEAAQANGEEEEEEETDMRSVAPERRGREDLSLEATQAYVSDPYHDSEDETDDEKQTVATDETQPFYVPTSATLAMAETQPMCALEEEEEEEEEEEDISSPVSTAGRVKVRSKNGAEERGGPALAETQPICTSGDSDGEDSFPGLRKRKTKQLPRIEEEQTQPLTSSEQSVVEAQPPSADEDPAPRGSRAPGGGNSDPPNRETLPFGDAKEPALVPPDPSAAETQLMVAGEGEDSDDGDSVLAPPRRKAKPLQYQDDTQTQPMSSGESGDEVASLPATEMTGGKPSQGLEEEADSKSPLQETQLSETKAEAEAEAGTSGRSVNGKKVPSRCDEPSRRRTRGRAASGRGKSKWGEEEHEGEKEEQAGKAGGIKSRRQRNDVEVEDRNEQDISQAQKREGPGLGESSSDTGLRRDLRGNLEEERKGTELEKMTLGVKEKEEEEKTEAELAQRSRLELERAERERERKEQEERAERIQKERADKERLEREEKERLEREKRAKIDNERKEGEEKEILERERRKPDESCEREGQQCSRQEREAKEVEGMEGPGKEKVTKEKILKEQEEDKAQASARGRRAARRTAAAVGSTEPAVAPDDDVPARRTRSRSNSSNSVCSERSASSAGTQGSRGRGRGARRTSDPPPAAASRSSRSRRKTAASGAADGNPDASRAPQGRGRGRGSRQRGRGGQAEAPSVSPATSQSDPKTTTRGRRSTKAEPSLPGKAATSRGQQRSGSNASEPEAEDLSNQGERSDDEEWLQPIRNVGSRSRKAAKSEAVAAPGSPAVGSPGQTKEARKGRKRESEGVSGRSSKCFKGEEREQEPGEAAGHQAQGLGLGLEVPVQAQRRGRASVAQTKRSPNPPDSGPGPRDDEEGAVAEPVEKRGRSRPSAVQKKRDEEQEEAAVLEPEVRTPARRKRQAPADASPLSKTPRSSSSFSSSTTRSPAAGARSRAVGHAYKVLFTGVVDEAGERVLAPLGGSMARGVADMDCLVTDKVRRTVKFLCAVAKGIPVVTTQWLEKSGKTGSFLPPGSFIVNDQEQERKFGFCLQESLKVASSQPLLQGYHIHVTKSVRPEPLQMKDILTCSGATFLPKMPGSHKAQTVVISCEEDWHLCAPALAASVPVVTAEFILTGILRQKMDLGAHALSPPPPPTPNAGRLQPAGGRARGRKRP